MSARRHTPAAAAADSMATVPALPWSWAVDFSRQQFAVATEGASTVFRGLEAMRKLQEQAANEAAARRAAAVEKLGAHAEPAALLMLQGELLRGDLESATRYWQELAATAFEINSELFGCATRLVDTDDAFAAARLLHS